VSKKSYLSQDDDLILQMRQDKKSLAEIAKVVGHSVASITYRIRALAKKTEIIVKKISTSAKRVSSSDSCEVRRCRNSTCIIYYGRNICEAHWVMHCDDKLDLKKEFGLEASA